MLTIREATPSDAEALHDLYVHHLNKITQAEPHNIPAWRDMLTRIAQNPFYHLLVGETDNRIVSSVTLIVIENLTHNLRPYAVIENVVTHTEFRGRHFATTLMDRACEIASGHGCYKIMLLTGSKQESTLRFYENCGYNRNDKTAFIRLL